MSPQLILNAGRILNTVIAHRTLTLLALKLGGGLNIFKVQLVITFLLVHHTVFTI